jgi:hypothetical protein
VTKKEDNVTYEPERTPELHRMSVSFSRLRFKEETDDCEQQVDFIQSTTLKPLVRENAAGSI